jgi:hypothetical protein
MSDATVERETLGPDAVLQCPNDGLEFRPYYTEGCCPLCRWRAPARVAEPWTHRADWVLLAFAGLVAVSILMAIIVFVAL